MRAGAGAVGLTEPIEDMGQEIGGDTDAGIPDRQLDGCANPPHGNVYPSAFRRELHGIRQQIVDDLLEPLRIGEDLPRVAIDLRLERDPLFFGARTHRLDRGFGGRRHRHAGAVQAQRS